MHNTVIRIALVKLSKSYSRISLSEIASILQLDSAEEACYTCMRVGVKEVCNGENIRDGIIQGRIEGDYFVTEEVVGMIIGDLKVGLCRGYVAAEGAVQQENRVLLELEEGDNQE